MFYSSAREIWENLIETYSMKEDSTTCYDIESKIFNSRQGTLSIIEYSGTLNGLWIDKEEIDRLRALLNSTSKASWFMWFDYE
ncbi:hypothetical protein CR513_42636, partial [Mucuna pruriens]